MSHLGDRIAAFVDGQLTPESAERATAHLAACRPCRDLVELERLTKARLEALSGPAPTADLLGRLLAMGGPSGPLPPRPGHVPGSPRAAAVPVRAVIPAAAARPPVRTVTTVTGVTAVQVRRTRPPGRPAGRPAVLGGRRGRLAVAVAGALSVVGVGVGGVSVGVGATAGGAGPAGPRIGTVTGGSGIGDSGTGAQFTTSLLPARVSPVDWFQSPVTTRTPAARFAVRR